MRFERKNGQNNIRCFCGNLLANPWITTRHKWYCFNCNKTYTDRQIFKLLSRKDKKRFEFWSGCHMPNWYKKRSKEEK